LAAFFDSFSPLADSAQQECRVRHRLVSDDRTNGILWRIDASEASTLPRTGRHRFRRHRVRCFYETGGESWSRDLKVRSTWPSQLGEGDSGPHNVGLSARQLFIIARRSVHFFFQPHLLKKKISYELSEPCVFQAELAYATLF